MCVCILLSVECIRNFLSLLQVLGIRLSCCCRRVVYTVCLIHGNIRFPYLIFLPATNIEELLHERSPDFRMLDSEAVITYKRKRFSSQSGVIHGTKGLNSSAKSTPRASSRILSPKVEIGACEKKLNEDYSVSLLNRKGS